MKKEDTEEEFVRKHGGPKIYKALWARTSSYVL